jgi:hypothetical protein
VARHQLRKSLADVIIELGEYYAFLISAFLYDDIHRLPAMEDIKSCEKQERNLQRAIVACRDLLNLTYHEPGLKAPFPTEFYNEMITTTQNLLDRLCNMRCAVVYMPIEVRKETVNADVYLYRRDMVRTQKSNNKDGFEAISYVVVRVLTFGFFFIFIFVHYRPQRFYCISTRYQCL